MVGARHSQSCGRGMDGRLVESSDASWAGSLDHLPMLAATSSEL
jgi:hypothetical protein